MSNYSKDYLSFEDSRVKTVSVDDYKELNVNKSH